MLLRVVQHRLSAAGLLALLTFYDVTNAFPSLDWEKLASSALRYFDDDDRYFLQARHRKGICFISDPAQAVTVFRPQTGTRQGDIAAAQQFAAAFGKTIRHWNRDNFSWFERRYLSARDPWTHTAAFIGSALLADDLTKISILAPLSAVLPFVRQTFFSLQEFLQS